MGTWKKRKKEREKGKGKNAKRVAGKDIKIAPARPQHRNLHSPKLCRSQSPVSIASRRLGKDPVPTLRRKRIYYRPRSRESDQFFSIRRDCRTRGNSLILGAFHFDVSFPSGEIPLVSNLRSPPTTRTDEISVRKWATSIRVRAVRPKTSGSSWLRESNVDRAVLSDTGY